MFSRTALAAAAVAALIATPLIAQTSSDKSKQKLSAQEFVDKAASGGMFEVESSKLAQDKAKRADVKQFAKKMIDDHGKANKELEQTAQKANLKVPKEMASKHKSDLDKLRQAQATQFDEAYIDAQAAAHREAIDLFTDYSKSGDNKELQQFAGKTLPTLQQHERDLKQLDQGSAATGASGGSSGQKQSK